MLLLCVHFFALLMRLVLVIMRLVLVIMRFVVNIMTLGNFQILSSVSYSWYSSFLISFSMVSSLLAKGFLILSTILLGFEVWSLVFTRFTHIKMFCILDSLRCMMRATMLIVLVHVIGMIVSIFGSFNFPLVLWTHFPIFLALEHDFAAAVPLFWLFNITVLVLRG